MFVEEQLTNAPISAATHLAVALVDFQLSQCKKNISLCHAKKLFGLKDHPTLPQGLLSLIIWPLVKPNTFVFLLIFVIVFLIINSQLIFFTNSNQHRSLQLLFSNHSG